MIKKIDILGARLGLLSLYEAKKLIDEYSISLPEKEKRKIDAIKNKKRKKEYVAIRLLLEKITGEKDKIYYNNKGKPSLKISKKHISISHSREIAAILISDKNAGIDVENINRDTKKIASRYLSDIELSHINQSPDSKLLRILYWCAKEASYKFSINQDIEFKHDIKILPFTAHSTQGTFYGELYKTTPFINLKFHYFIYKENAIVYCFER